MGVQRLVRCIPFAFETEKEKKTRRRLEKKGESAGEGTPRLAAQEERERAAPCGKAWRRGRVATCKREGSARERGRQIVLFFSLFVHR